MRLFFMLFFLVKSFFSSSQAKIISINYVNFNDTIVPEDKRYINQVNISDTISTSYRYPYMLKAPGMYLVNSKDGISKYEYYSEKDSVKLYVYKHFIRQTLFFDSEYGLGINWSRKFKDSLHPFQWNIYTETRRIGNQICKKATMYFRGRNYIAWFDETIPIMNGPWKFGGLPGLIIEIYDETFTVYWTLSKLEYKVKLEMPVFPENISETYAEYKKIYRENFLRLKKAIESSDGVSNTNCQSCTGSKKTITDNSVEDLLTDN